MWLHEQGFKKEREIDVHNDYSCRPKPASSVSLSVVAYRGSLKCRTKHVFLVYNSSLQNITHIKLSLAHFTFFCSFKFFRKIQALEHLTEHFEKNNILRVLQTVMFLLDLINLLHLRMIIQS